MLDSELVASLVAVSLELEVELGSEVKIAGFHTRISASVRIPWTRSVKYDHSFILGQHTRGWDESGRAYVDKQLGEASFVLAFTARAVGTRMHRFKHFLPIEHSLSRSSRLW